MAPDTGTTSAAAGMDEAYEFSAPRFFDFINEETEEAVRAAESWFETGCSHAPSPFNPRIKESRAEVKVAVLCDFADAAEEQPAPKQEAVEGVAGSVADHAAVDGNAQEKKDASFGSVSEANHGGICATADSSSQQQEKSAACPEAMPESPPVEEEKKESPESFEFIPSRDPAAKSDGGSASTPKMQRPPPPIEVFPAISACARSIVKTEARTPKTQANVSKVGPMAGSMSVKRSVIKGARDLGAGKAATAATEIAQDNQAVKRQKLDDGRTRQILDVKTRVLHHKGRGGIAESTGLTQSSMRRAHDGAHSAKEVTSYVSAAELVKKFESGTRGIPHNRSLSHEDAAAGRPKLMLTRPKEPELQTANRVRAVRVKSSAELEEEMLAKIPKFRARPFNKKIAEAPAFPPLPRKTPQVPKFNVFHLKTMERATRHADTCSEASSVGTIRNQSKSLKLTEPKPPQLHTAMRARPPSVKSSQELELEELEKAPKFKAKPLNKKILESKGDVGVFAHPKPPVTAPKEFHFSTDYRLGPPSVADSFDKLSLYSESSSHNDRKDVPRLTVPNPFNLHTEERGHLKERQLAAQLLQKQMEEEKARVHKAKPYPYTTDYPVVPPKPDPKTCTRPEGFQLESLVRHEREQQRLMEERERTEREEAQMRIIKAQPILKEDPIPLPEKERKPLTEVQQFALHVDERAVQRSEFDNMIKEKEKTYKRLREENEFAQKIEEEKALKQMRRTMVPHARALPKFDRPFRPQKSMKQVTKPKSPQLQVDERRARRHACSFSFLVLDVKIIPYLAASMILSLTICNPPPPPNNCNLVSQHS
ncbi:protein TPX2-like isoform X2 [Phragmites australis]|uniref:protein TPX2-like isoform X2 n=1 Tax=Phragmites australis TaxID=29695 RepID=UPI002D79229A|nr:protein TPX2-like isoform X2 [Phragmites australis]